MKRNATRRLLTALLAAAMCLSMAACGSKPAADNGSSDTDTSAGDDAARKYTIGVCQLVTHDALDAATQGFIDAVQEKLGADNVDISVQNAANDQNVCTTIVNTFVSQKVDLIMANATPSLQAAYNATTEIPILGTAVTEYGVALGLKDFNGTVGGNVRSGAPHRAGGHDPGAVPRGQDCGPAVLLRRAQLRVSGPGGGGIPHR